MPSNRIVASADGYVVTQQGHEDLVYAETCDCRPRISGLLVTCTECGTVYGHLKDSATWGMHGGGYKS